MARRHSKKPQASKNKVAPALRYFKDQRNEAVHPDEVSTKHDAGSTFKMVEPLFVELTKALK